MAIRPLTVIALSLLLTASSLPISPAAVVAAPPDPGAKLESGESASKEETLDSDETEHESLNRPPDELIDKEESASGKRALRGWPGFESIRRRGLEAPVELRQPVPEVIDEAPDKGDGEPPQTRSAANSESDPDSDKDGAREKAPRERDIRIWPMRADTYTFTQPFGCVPQIANFYFPGENCPPSAPVIHSGIDLGAPEGIPFYAAASGWVTGSGYDREVGVPNTRIIIQHDGRNDGFATEYLHWIATFVEEGDYVEAGEQIGEVGSVGYSTGAHLHFSVVDLEIGEHIDPVRWLPDEPGSQGYRGIRPNARADMRLPAGTTAGLPESADPAPPPPPEREDVPESPPPSDEGDRSKDRSREKRKRHRDERRAETRNATVENRATEESIDAPETETDESLKEGKKKERTRKRERNKDGRQSENAEKGEDGSGKRKSDEKGSDNSGAREKDRGHHGNGNGNGHGDRRQDNRSDNGKDKQHRTNDRDRNDRDKQNDSGGNEGNDGTDGSGGDDGGEDDGTDPDDDRGNGGNEGTGDDAPRDNGEDSGADQPAEDSTDDGGEDKGNGDVQDGESTAAQPADDTTVKPGKKPKRRKSS